MKKIRWRLLMAVSVLGLILLASAGTAAAAPDHSRALGHTHDIVLVDAPVQPTFEIPGVVSLTFGGSVGDSQVELPSLNAVATVSGLTLGPTPGWDSITLSQKEPSVTRIGTIAGAQVSVHGPQTGYSADASALFDLHPGRGFQTSGQVAVVYDGLSRRVGVSLRDATVTVPTWPVGFAATGINSDPGTFRVESAQVALPVAGTAVTLNGFQVANGRSSWDTLTIAQAENAPLKIGDVLMVSGTEVAFPSPGTGLAATAASRVELNAGQIAHMEGWLTYTSDPTAEQSRVAIKDGLVTVQIPGWGLALQGINSAPAGVKIDSVVFSAERIGLEAEVTGIAVGGGSGFTFDQARITYAPEPAAGATASTGGFQMTITRKEGGYELTTVSTIPAARTR